MPINGFQLSKSQSMDSGSRTKSPDDNRVALQKHEDTRNEALYGSLKLLQESNVALYSIADKKAVSKSLLKSNGIRPRYVNNIRGNIRNMSFNLKDSYLNRAFKKKS
tara:strand:- start:1034 stop:1354 length:321 start_codon:yes stop_codon:yes gene_type:complete